MSATIRDLVDTKTCICGKGKYEKYRCETANPFSMDDWEEVRIKCTDCNSKYSVKQVDSKFHLVTNQSLEKSKKLSDKAYKLRKKLLQTKEVTQMLEIIKSKVLSEKYATKKHEIFSKAGMYIFNIARFRKEYNDSDIDSFIEDNLYTSDLGAMENYLKSRNEIIELKLKEIDIIEKESESCIEIIDPSIY